MKTKICGKCKKRKSLDRFIKNKTCTNGVAGTCKKCSNTYSASWKREHSQSLSAARRLRYAETEGREVKERERRRRERFPLRVKCQLLRQGMILRARVKHLPFDRSILTTAYLMARIELAPTCECCGVEFDLGLDRGGVKTDRSPSVDRIRPALGYVVANVAILCWRCNNLKRDSSPSELRMIADWMWDAWGNEIPLPGRA